MKIVPLITSTLLVSSLNLASLSVILPGQNLDTTDPTAAWAQGPPAPNNSTGNPPPRDPPRTPGDLPGTSCHATAEDFDLSMITIRPVGSDQGVTASNTPTLLFYIPYSSETIDTAEVTISTRNRRTGRDIYTATVELPSTPGFVSFTLPLSDSGTSYLEEEEYYRWYFSLTCTSGDNEPLERTLRGWIRRLDPVSAPGEQRFYYDELQAAFDDVRRGVDPDQWTAILREINLEAYSDVRNMGTMNRLSEISF